MLFIGHCDKPVHVSCSIMCSLVLCASEMSLLLCADKLLPVHDGVTTPVCDSAGSSSALDVDVGKLSIREVGEPVAEAAATDAASESHLLAPFSHLLRLNLAQNKV